MKIRLGIWVFLFMLISSPALSASGQDITGTWRGVLNAGPEVLHIVLHVNRSSTGALKADFDSVDQGAYGIKVNSISLEGSKLSFAIDAAQASYEGVVATDGKSIDGTWTQGQQFPLNFTRASQNAEAETKPAKPSDIDGAWLGTLDTGTIQLRVVFHIWNTTHGLTASMDSPDQGAGGIPVTSVVHNGSKITMQSNAVGGEFVGSINASHTAMAGTWTQGGGSLPLILKRMKSEAELQVPRPQNPKGPLPYRQQEVKFEDKQAGVQLAGTLTIPPGKGPFPAVVLIAGSGPHNRNEEVMGHKVFLVLADYLTRKDIVVLRYDKRGVGQSQGNYGTATTADFANDAEAAFNFLRTQPEVNPHEVGLIGHSEGGVIAPIVAARDRNVDFIVMMAGPGVSGAQILVEQTLAISEAMGMKPEEAQKSAQREQECMTLVLNSKSGPELKRELRAKLAGVLPKARLGAAVSAMDSPWFRYFVRYDPVPTLEKVKCPVLAMIGSKDTQVPARYNLAPIRKALTEGGNKDFQVVEMPGLNHLFQPAKTGAPIEYGQIEITIAPGALEKISSWILKETAQH